MTVTWLFVNLLIMICSKKYNLFSTISRHQDEVLKDDDTKKNDWLLEMNYKYLIDLKSNSSEELQRIELKNLRLEIYRREYSSLESRFKG